MNTKHLSHTCIAALIRVGLRPSHLPSQNKSEKNSLLKGHGINAVNLMLVLTSLQGAQGKLASWRAGDDSHR